MKTPIAAVLLAIATELAESAKTSLPKLRDGEIIKQEWLDNGIYYRETEMDGKIFLGQYDFRLRKSSVM